MKNCESMFKILILIINIYCYLVNGIQVFESDQNDTTTATSILMIVPTTKIIDTTTPSIKSINSELLANNTATETIVDNATNNGSARISKEMSKGFEKKKKGGDKLVSSKLNHVDQQQKSSAQQVQHKKFIPSPELSSIVSNTKHNSLVENFYPTNSYFKPLSMINNNNNNYRHIEMSHGPWTKDLSNLPKQFHKTIDNTPQIVTKEITNPTTNGHWVWMPDEQQQPKSEEKPIMVLPESENWKWNFDQYFKENPSALTTTGKPQTPLSYDSPKIYQTHPYFKTLPKEYSYSFELSTTPATFSYETSSAEEEKHKKENYFQHNLELLKPTPTHIPEWTQLLSGFGIGGGGGVKGHDSIEQHSTKNVSPWKKIIHVLSAAIPIGLLISALTPQVIYVNPNSTAPNPGQTVNLMSSVKQHRGLNNQILDNDELFTNRKLSNPLMDFLNMLNSKDIKNYDGNYNNMCDNRNFCEISLKGLDENANVLQKMLLKIAIETPKEQALRSGLYEIFEAIKSRNCSIFSCPEPLTTIFNHETYEKRSAKIL